MKLGVGEALQCPTILNNGFGDHRIEGIGDKHIPWIHNVKNTDMVIAIDDEDSQRLLRLFNDPAGLNTSRRRPGWTGETIEKLPGWASPASPTSSAASRWPSTTSSPSPGRGGHRPHRLSQHVRLPYPGAGGPVRPPTRAGRRRGPQPSYAGRAHRLHGGADLSDRKRASTI